MNRSKNKDLPNSSSCNASGFGGCWCCLCFYQMEFARFENDIGCLLPVQGCFCLMTQKPGQRFAFFLDMGVEVGWGGMRTSLALAHMMEADGPLLCVVANELAVYLNPFMIERQEASQLPLVSMQVLFSPFKSENVLWIFQKLKDHVDFPPSFLVA